MKTAAEKLSGCPGEKEVMRSLRPRQLVQSVKAICAFLGNLELLEVQDACDFLVRSCLEFDRARGGVEDPASAARLRPEIVEEVAGERYATVVLTNKQEESSCRQISSALERVRETVQKSVETYASTFRVNFSLTSTISASTTRKESIEVYETLLIRFCALHRLQVSANSALSSKLLLLLASVGKLGIRRLRPDDAGLPRNSTHRRDGLHRLCCKDRQLLRTGQV